ncbi:MAG TPA: 2Fe-2S iron-sulfur cluster-binding protein, partial [Verrucomicrobiae bacterium]|nr:2Fe-2S iron-sulfur cluster-binding protein [Verrucomicrobiae bacterium]
MPKLTIDGKEIEVPAGTRLIEAAKKCGIDVPFYCYHPGLSVSGNCRMCLVEVEKTPKLQIACHIQAADGMVVKTQTEQVLKTRQHVLEFLLLNHPVDCPVCDQAGECWLQDYYMKHGLYNSRLGEDKVKKPKAVPLGPTVMLDAERCILCSRCIRFCDEVSKTSELGFIQRGDHTEIAVAPGKELDNKYSGNTVDICPVGALTDRDFRFKIRVWYLKEEDSICNGCSRGCNIQVHYNLDRPQHGKGERVKRLKPRFNERVNKWWMCDEGRYGYKYHDRNRITA